ncbi:glutaredoxin family protein [Leptolyngbya sp. AN02str]|uniref:glutaredoxin family protein n=1 Tax=Leptolyngbya sp. AN02str TaxID=3423363 RepID=UPI003D31C4C5
MYLILYSKPDCHLCEGLIEKLEQIEDIPIELEIRDITTNPQWFAAYQYEIPVLFWDKTQSHNNGKGNHTNENGRSTAWVQLPRLSPRASVQQLSRLLKNALDGQA